MISYLEIAGKRYPMSFSLGAQKAIVARYGGMECLGDLRSRGLDEQDMDMLIWMTELLIAQGCAYKNYFEKDIPAPKDAPVDADGKWIPLPAEAIEVGITELQETGSRGRACGGHRKKRRDHAGPLSFAWYDFWGRELGAPVLEYSCMPVGEFLDLIAVCQIRNGAAREAEKNTGYIPDLR